MNSGPRWLMPATGLGLGFLVAAADYLRNGSLVGSAASFSIIVVYALAVVLVSRRSETASLLAGRPVDERWQSINLRALASAAVVMALVLLGAFVVAEIRGGDPMPYAWLAAAFAASYGGFILWFRWRS